MIRVRYKLCKALTREISLEMVKTCKKNNVSVTHAIHPLITDTHAALFSLDHAVMNKIENS